MAGQAGDTRRRARGLLGEPTNDGRQVMRGLHFAIVDEADSVLVDEARTPLILSRQSDVKAEREWAETAIDLARELEEGVHYRLIPAERRIDLTAAGRDWRNNFV